MKASIRTKATMADLAVREFMLRLHDIRTEALLEIERNKDD